MKSLNYYELENNVALINDKIRNNHVSSISVINSTDIILSLSFYRHNKLLISLNHSSPFISFIDKDISYPTITGKLNETLRSKIKDSYITNIESIKNERIVKFSLQKLNEFGEREVYSLLIELIPQHPNLLILDKDNLIIFANHYSSIDSERIIVNKFEYSLPKHSEYKCKNVFNYDSFLDDVSNYVNEMEQKRLEELFSPLKRFIEKEIKISKKKNSILLQEIKEAETKLSYQDIANNLLMLQYDKTELDLYIKDNNIMIDPSLSLNKNIEKLFLKYKKSKKTIEINNVQLEENNKRLETFTEYLLLFKNKDIDSLIDLSNKYLKTNIRHEHKTIPSNIPYVLEIPNGKIMFGKNANQNDYLTFKVAQKDSLFFHVKNYSGSHVILTSTSITDENILLAAEIAIFTSGQEIGEVDYCLVSSLKRGSKPGQVLLSSHKSITIKIVHDGTKQLVKKSKRLTF